ncbi:Ufm1-specific protease 2 [Elysia marginata]|uniref:Ufm1-specific protease 2 n=1 Tax=Elysia marginata TaxID=1093978 RepID=A0AAV4GXS4_9GAST|nr:Ufm1-specific protease 2 [Elysia marginata]
MQLCMSTLPISHECLHSATPRQSPPAVYSLSVLRSLDVKLGLKIFLEAKGQRVVGVVVIPKNSKAIKSIQDNDQAGIDRELEEVLGAFDVWLDQFGLTQVLCLCLYQEPQTSTKFQASMFVINEDGINSETMNLDAKPKAKIRLRLKADLPLVISSESNTEEQLNSALDQELVKLQNQCGSFVFGFFQNSVILHQSGFAIGSAAENWSNCKDIYKSFLEEEGLNEGMSKKKCSSSVFQAPILVSMLRLATADSSSQYAPIIRHQTGTLKSTALNLPLDVLVEVEDSISLKALCAVLASAVSCQIGAQFECLKMYTQKQELHTPEVFHFQLLSLDTPVTVIYPFGASEEELEPERQILHRRLCLPTSSPMLRRGCAGHFLHRTAPAGYLMNTHLGLSDPPIKSATTCLVQGFYSYHHYMQDRFNDDKWGCAYRSLQTICSWFKYQGYTTKDIPSHRQIQQALCDIGDKEQKFVGSRQWIGSFEVSFVLDHLLQVTSKFINVASGAELSTVGQQLMDHFATQGTPIMIGGGVLAHTILGVSYSELSGDIAFLILDPHYTGGEDLRVIQDKGWCGWKDMTFWNQTAHYNLCLPQRPNTTV